MFKRIISVMLLFITLFGCVKKQNNQDESRFLDDARFFPMPEFAVLFSSLDYVQRVDFDRVIPDLYNSDITNVNIAAFYLGNLTADAIVATRARNKTKLAIIAVTMIDYSRMIGINQEVLKLADDLMNLLQDDKWEELLIALDTYKSKIELSLYQSRQLDLMTLLQAGGWTRGINIMTSLLLQDFNIEYSRVLNQKGIVDNLTKNLAQMEDLNIYNIDWFKNLKEGYSIIHSIINVQNKETFNEDEIKRLNDISKDIITKIAG